MYHNSAKGVEKSSHERMLNNQGRKVIRERVGNDQRNYDHYKGLTSEDAGHFDQKWNQMAGQMGFKSKVGNALEYGGNDYNARHLQRGGAGRHNS